MCYQSGDCLNPGKRVGDDVLAGYMSDVRRELRDKIQMVKLLW
jgi:hypothetical protein